MWENWLQFCCRGPVAVAKSLVRAIEFLNWRFAVAEGGGDPELPDGLALPGLGCFEPELGEDIDEDITDNIDPLGNRSATSYSFITTVNFKFKIFQLASQSILDFRF